MTTATSDRRRTGERADVLAALGAAALVLAAAIVGVVLSAMGSSVHAAAPPLYARWLPHLGPGTPLAVAVAALVVWRGPDLAARLPWPRALQLAYAASVSWIVTLAMVDGWHRGIARRLTTGSEYLHDVPRVTDLTALLSGFTDHILATSPEPWTTHVSGHPPGILGVFVALDRIGLGGGGSAGMLCVLVGALVAVAVPQTVRLLGDEHAARAAVPFAVLVPGAVWIGVSADGLFAGVAASGTALVALGLAKNRAAPGLLGGALVATAAYLSYGLILLAPIVLAVVVVARRVRPLGWSLAGAAAVVAAFTIAGFWWLDGYHLVVQRYYQGVASERAYGYWVWANIAALAVAAGPAAAPILRRASVGRSLSATHLLPLAALLAIIAADLSGLSKAEVERIWLPFAVWFMAGAGLLPEKRQRTWLVAQAATALLVNHLVLTNW